jgi:casein kinase II subunit beta
MKSHRHLVMMSHGFNGALRFENGLLVGFSIHTLHLLYNRFCGLKGQEFFCEVERSYIEDGFNLYGLRACVSNFSDCLDLILDRIGPDDSDDSHLTQSACTLYALIHARYIITAHGLDAMYNKV